MKLQEKIDEWRREVDLITDEEITEIINAHCGGKGVTENDLIKGTIEYTLETVLGLLQNHNINPEI